MNENLTTTVSLTLNVLSAIPNPISGPIIGIVQQIWTAVQLSAQNKNQIRQLFKRVCLVLQMLQVPQDYSDSIMRDSLDTLIHNLENVLKFVVTEQKKGFLKSVWTSDELRVTLEDHERNIVDACLSFQNAALLSANKKLDNIFGLVNSESKRSSEQDALQEAYLQDISDRLAVMQAAVSYPSFLDTLLETMDINYNQTMTAMRSVLARDSSALSLQERGFLMAGIERLEKQHATVVNSKIHAWTITGLEVEKGYLLGNDPTCFIRLGKWRKTVVDMWEMKSNEKIEQLITIWGRMKTDRIVSLVGGSTVDAPPYILTEHIGPNVIEYLSNTSESAIPILAHDIISGLQYLHTMDPPIVHGALRPCHVFVNNAGRAVVAGAAIVSKDYYLGFRSNAAVEAELHQHLAPEQTTESIATIESDIYSFGVILRKMLLFVRRTQADKTLTSLVEECTNPDPSRRPNASTICDVLSQSSQVKDPELFVPQSHSPQSELEGSESTWRMARYTSDLEDSYFDGQDVIYLQSLPISGNSDRPLRKLCFQLKCHDQGAEYTSADPRNGTYCWVEMSLYREGQEVNIEEELPSNYRGHLVQSRRQQIIRCPFADSTPRVHLTTFDQDHPIVKLAKKGDQIRVYPKALFPGWQIYMYSCDMQVITE